MTTRVYEYNLCECGERKTVGARKCLDCSNHQPRTKRPVEERFWEKVDRRGPDECWPWTAAQNRFGYGAFGVTPYQIETASRVAWELTNGPISTGLGVLHRCDNPPCCNPAHLFLGTHADNMADMARKGRNRRRDGEGMTQTDRVVMFLRANPGCSTMELQLALHPFVSNPRARISDARALGVEIRCETRSDGRKGYRVVDHEPEQLGAFG